MEEMDTSSSTLPAYFPRVAKECKGVAKEFFDCFSTESKYAPGMDPHVGTNALAKCSVSLEAYKQCSATHLKHRSLVDAPEVYVARAGGALE